MNGLIVADVAIAGGGIIGLSLGLELRRRGLTVVVVERQKAMSSASWAAGGMLAVHDPQNPAELLPLSLRSWELYPAYLERRGGAFRPEGAAADAAGDAVCGAWRGGTEAGMGTR